MRKAFWMAIAGVVCAGLLHAADEALPKADEVMEKYVAATGGRAAYEKRKAEISTGAMEFTANGIKGTLTAYADSSNNMYSVVDIEGVGKIEQGVYNGIAWESSAIQGSRIREGAEKADVLRESTWNAELKWRELYTKAEVVGVEDVQGSPAYKVLLTPKEGKPQTAFFDKKTGLLTKRVAIVANPMGEIEMETLLSDYKKIGDMMRATKMTQKMMGMEFTIAISDIKTNVDIPKERFEPPAEVKKLIDKGAAPAAAK